MGEPLEVGAGIRDRRELPAALEEVRGVRARLERRSGLRGREEERPLGIDLRLERANRLRVRRVEDVEAIGSERQPEAPRARATTRPCPARRSRRRRPRRRRRSRTRGRRRVAPTCAAARRASRASSLRRLRSRQSGRGPRSARRCRWQRPRSDRGQRFALRVDPLLQLVERVDELLHALALERLGHVVVVEPRVAQVVEQLPRLVDPLLERLGARRRDPGRRRWSPRAWCSRCRGRSAPRRTSRRGSPGSSWTSTPRGSAAQSRPSPRAVPSARRRTRACSSGTRASRSRSPACPGDRCGRARSRRLSASVSTRETKNDATEQVVARSPPRSASRSSPRT